MLMGYCLIHWSLFQGGAIQIKEKSDCGRESKVTCNGELIAIKKLITTNTLAREIAKCNGLEECTIENPSEICYYMEYWCLRSKYCWHICKFFTYMRLWVRVLIHIYSNFTFHSMTWQNVLEYTCQN